MPYFSSAQFQQGFEIGDIFSSLGLSVLMLVKKETKSIGREILKSGTNFVSDVLESKNLKQATLNRAKETGSNLLQKMATVPRKKKTC